MLGILRIAALLIAYLKLRGRREPNELKARMMRLSRDDRQSLVLNIMTDGRAPLLSRGLAAIPTAYMYSPIDLVPDFLPFIGHVDDELIFDLASEVLVRVTPRRLLEEHLERVSPIRQSSDSQRAEANRRPWLAKLRQRA